MLYWVNSYDHNQQVIVQATHFNYVWMLEDVFLSILQ